MTTTSRPRFLLNAQYLPSSVDWRTSGGRWSPFEFSTFVEQAQRAETAGFDAVFQADFSGVNRAALRSGPPLTVFEPFQAAALVAAATTRIAVMPTVSTLHTHPFSFARSLASLDRLSRGRAWVNVVSSFRPGTALGAQRAIPRERRHDQTAEFLEVARRLWHSWPTAANVPDPATDRYVRDDLVRDLDHHGEFYDQAGPIDMPPFSDGFPFTLQATSSEEGLRLAARTADGVFAGTPTLGAARALRDILRDEAVRAGRAPDSVALLPGCYVHVVGPEEQERLAFAERHRASSAFVGQGALAQLRRRYPALRLDGVDASDRLPADVLPEDPAEVFAAHGTSYLPLWDLARRGARDAGAFATEAIGLAEHARFVGSPERIADDLVRWIEQGAVDGFQIILGTDFDAVADRILPRVRAATASRSGAAPPVAAIHS